MQIPPVFILYSERLLAHFSEPSNAGELPAPALAVDVENPVCGDRLRLSARVEDGRFAEVRFLAKGCTASIAAGSALTVWMTGRALAEIAAMDDAFIRRSLDDELGGLPPASRHAAALCADAVRLLLQSR